MNHKERVHTAIRHEIPDITPKGDLAIEEKLIRSIIGRVHYGRMSANERLLATWNRLGADLVNIHEFPMERVGRTDSGSPIFRSVLGDEHVMAPGACRLHRPAMSDIAEAERYETPDASTCKSDSLDWFVANSDLFVFAQIMGPVSALDWMLGTEDFLVYCMTETNSVRDLMEKVANYEITRAKIFLDHGADAIMITDDIAYNGGLFLPPRIMEELVWDLYVHMLSEIKNCHKAPVFLHTDGDIREVLGNIVKCGFDGLHSLQPSAGMDIVQVKRDFGNRLCLMGNMDLNHLMPYGAPEEVSRQAKWLCETIGGNGGFILATCNVLTGAIPLENVYAMYGVSPPDGSETATRKNT